MKHSFPKSERLKSTKSIDSLFAHGQKLSKYPVMLLWHAIPSSQQTSGASTRVAFAVSKKKMKLAVDRNLIKRRMREAYRLNKASFPLALPNGHELHFILIFIGKDIATWPAIEKSVMRLLKKLSKALQPIAEDPIKDSISG